MPQRLNLPLVSTCIRRKERHHTRAEAEGLRLFLISVGRHQPERGPLQSYWCESCGSWHVGHGVFQ